MMMVMIMIMIMIIIIIMIMIKIIMMILIMYVHEDRDEVSAGRRMSSIDEVYFRIGRSDTYDMSHITCHIIYVTYDISHMTCHISHVITSHISYVVSVMSEGD